jgi:hypothetical protein
MKIKLCILLLSTCFVIQSSAQEKVSKKFIPPSGANNSASLGVVLPLGNFSNTHFGGIALEYSRSNNRFSIMDKRPSKKFGFDCNAGAAYYFGKKENIVTTTYKYPAYTFLHLYGGAIYNVSRQANITLTAGPAVGLYNGITSFNIGAILDASFYIQNRIAVTPGILMMKESGADPLWAASLKATIAF